jgi:dTDP-4-dehydrorhamnose 3,5-epimerase
MRGLHFQTPPHSQAKLVRVLHGAVSDVAVDIRAGSPTYGHWVSATLTAENRRQLFVPHGFAHGFFTLKPHTVVVYAVDNEYAPDHEAGILWNDPGIAIDWPDVGCDAVLSDKDRHQPPLAELPAHFFYEG